MMDAAKAAGISRQTLYDKHINAKDPADQITVEEDARGRRVIDTAEIIRIFGELKPLTADTKQNTSVGVNVTHELRNKIRTLEMEVTLLHEQLRDAKDQLRKAETREEQLHVHIVSLTALRQQDQPQKQLTWIDKLLGRS